MTFSNAVAQQRVKQTLTLKRFVACSLVGSLAVHGVGMFLKISQPKADEAVTPEEITIVVTELPDEIPPEEETVVGLTPDPEAPMIATAPAANVAPANAVEVPIEPAATEEPVPEEADDEPEPSPSPVADVPVEDPIEEEISEETIDETTVDETTPESVSDEAPEQVAEALEPTPRNLRDLLNDLRQSRSPSTSTETAAATDATPSPPPRGFAPGQFNRPTTTQGETTAVGPTSPGIGEGPPAESSGEGDDPRPSQGSGSREITCEGCDFDYPDEAEGAEGEAQVIVETDDQGNVVSVTLSRSTGNAALDRAAIEQARQRVRLNNAQGGESYPIDIEFVQPNSDAARRARERGDRRRITVTETEPDAATEQTPETTPSPAEQTANPESDDSPEPNRPADSDDSASDRLLDIATPSEPADATTSPIPSLDSSDSTDGNELPSSLSPSPTSMPPPESPSATEPSGNSNPQPLPAAPRSSVESEAPPPPPPPVENSAPTPVTPPPVDPSPSDSVDAE
jgi:TonB family protein